MASKLSFSFDIMQNNAASNGINASLDFQHSSMGLRLLFRLLLSVPVRTQIENAAQSCPFFAGLGFAIPMIATPQWNTRKLIPR